MPVMPRSLSRRSILSIVLGGVILSGLLYACAGLGGSRESPWKVSENRMVLPDIGEVAWFAGGEDAVHTVIFVHGTPGSATAWKGYIHDVPAGFRFIAIDRPGFGGSSNRAVTELDRQAKAIEPFLPQRGASAILVGHSLGGPIIARAAIDFPDRVGALVILAGSLDPGLEKINPLQYFGRWWPISRLLPRSLYNSNLELFALETELEKLARDLGRITIPVIIVHGTKDRLVPYDNVAFMEQMMTNARLEIVTLEDRNHFLPWNSRDVVDEAIQKASYMLDESAKAASLID